MSAHILIIDDELEWLQCLEFILTTKGYRVTATSQGEEGLALLQAQPEEYDIVLLDMMIPDLDGLEILSSLQPTLAKHPMPIIMQTGSHDIVKLEQALHYGALCCMRKPYSHRDLYPILESIVSSTPMPNHPALLKR